MTKIRTSAQAIRDTMEQLHRVRLDRDLTYPQLASEIGVSRRNLFRVMNDRHASMQDRTLHKIRLYLERIATSGTTEATA